MTRNQTMCHKLVTLPLFQNNTMKALDIFAGKNKV
jgi:hypothetical protein